MHIDDIFRQLSEGYPLPELAAEQQLQLVEMLQQGVNNVTLSVKAGSAGPEAVLLITETQLRDDLTKGRGPGLVAVMGEERVRSFFELCRESSEGGNRIKSGKTGDPIEGTEGRGMRQLAADILSIALVATDDDPRSVQVRKEFADKINRRLWRSWLVSSSFSQEELDPILARFEALGLEKPTSKTASVHHPEDNVWTIWLFLTGRLA